MSNTVLTLICNPKTQALGNELAGKLMCHLDHHDFGAPHRAVLADGIAEDYHFGIGPEHHTDLDAAARAFLKRLPIDVVVQRFDQRQKRFLIADMDSTIIEQECIDELADFAGLRDEISEITERAMRGELDFEAALRERVARLKGLPESVLHQAFEEKISLTPGARTLVQTMKARGATTALVSGGFTYFTGRVAKAVGFDIQQANELGVEHGKLTGTVAEPILGRAAKKEALKRIAETHKIEIAETLAVGDGANDLSMLGAAGLGVAFHAKPAVAEAADVRIDHGDLTALLYLQGIPEREFVTD